MRNYNKLNKIENFNNKFHLQQKKKKNLKNIFRGWFVAPEM